MSRIRINTNDEKIGFTLIEILVVLGILLLLSAISFGIFARVRTRSRTTLCQNNLHQMALALQQYTADHGGLYPANWWVDNKYTNHGKFHGWQEELFPYVKDESIFICPQRATIVRPPSVTPPGPLRDTIYYRFNTGILNRFAHLDPIGKNETVITHPEITWSIADQFDLPENFNDIPFSDYPRSSCDDPFSPWDTIHSGKSNYAFLDGHVKLVTSKQVAEMYCVSKKE